MWERSPDRDAETGPWHRGLEAAPTSNYGFNPMIFSIYLSLLSFPWRTWRLRALA
jgi:hypothetical protein